MRFPRFGVGFGNTVNCDTFAPRKNKRKLQILCRLSIRYYFTRVLICLYFLTVKRMIVDHAKKHVNYNDKLRWAF